MWCLRTVICDEVVKCAIRDSLGVWCGLAIAVDVSAVVTHLSSVWFHLRWLYDG